MTQCKSVTFADYLRKRLGLVDKNCEEVYKKSIDMNGDSAISADEIIDTDDDGRISGPELESFAIHHLLNKDDEYTEKFHRFRTKPFAHKLVNNFAAAIKNMMGAESTNGQPAYASLCNSAVTAFGNSMATMFGPILKKYFTYVVRSPLTIEFPDRTRTVRTQNATHEQLFVLCAPGFIYPNMTTTSEMLDECMFLTGNKSFEHTKIPDVLDILHERTVLARPEADDGVDRIRAAVKASPNVELEAKSVDADKTEAERVAAHLKDHETLERPDFIGHYARIYGAPKVADPELTAPDETVLIPNLRYSNSYDPTMDHNPPILRALIGDDTVYAFLNTEGTVKAYTHNELWEAKALGVRFADEIEDTARILATYHPDIKYENFKNALYSRISGEAKALDFEDPWQDLNACRFSGCALLERFEGEFAGERIGPIINGVVVNAPWELGSKIYAPMRKQGFGPAQIILGIAMEAAVDEKTLKHFRGMLTKKDFADEKAGIRTILEKPIFAYALCLDYALSKLEKTVFKDPNARMLTTNVPFPQTPRDARALSLLSSAKMIIAYPESDQKVRDEVTWSRGGLPIDCLWGELHDAMPLYQGLRTMRYVREDTLYKDNTLTDYFAFMGAANMDSAESEK